VLHCTDGLSNKVSKKKTYRQYDVAAYMHLLQRFSADDGTVIRCDSVLRASLVRRGCTRVGEDVVWVG
jgi:hypothetical protein